MAGEQTYSLMSTFNFSVRLIESAGSEQGDVLVANGAFQEVSGLEVEMDVQEYYEGGRNDGVVRRIGRAKYSNIVLKRGMLVPESGKAVKQFWEWFQNIVSGVKVVRYDGIIEVLGRDGTTSVANWEFVRGLPAKLKGPELNAKTGEIAIEELHISHEGLYLR